MTLAMQPAAGGDAKSKESPPRSLAIAANGRAFHAMSLDDAARLLGSSRAGLTAPEAEQRLRRYGANELHATPPVSPWRLLLDQLRSVVVLLLIAATAISLAVGDLVEAAAIGGVLLINTSLGFVIEMRARRAMAGLLRFEVKRASVRRDGRVRNVDARELVPGDVIELEAGAGIPADGRLFEGADVQTMEATLTGESLPVGKTVATLDADAPLPDRSNMLYMGTTVVGGAGRALVVATGAQTELGRVGELVGSIVDQSTPLEKRLDTLGRRLVWLALLVGVVVAALAALRGAGWFTVFQTGLALAVAAVPEGLPAVATITLALGVRRMAQRRALIRRLPSVETLGSVTLICTDKTGTLTIGQPTVTVVAPHRREIRVTGTGLDPAGELVEHERPLLPPLDETLAHLLRAGVLVNHASLSVESGVWCALGDPTEAALLVMAQKARVSREEVLAQHPVVGEVPFSSERMFMATFHHAGEELRAYVKGAPGRVLDLCSFVAMPDEKGVLDIDARAALESRNAELASRGLRVLGLATGIVPDAREASLRELVFLGFVGMVDPIASGVRDTVAAFRTAGIRTVMITGDQSLTARAIGQEIGIVDSRHDVLDGRAMAELGDVALAERIASTGAISRISPEDKLRVVAACQARGEVVAMLGDGVNDAAALRKADVGVAMGLRGTDVAKEAADVVLQDDRFATVAPAIEEGRVVFDNIRKFVLYLFSCNLAEVFVLVGGAAALSLPLLPLQILWLNLVTDTFPALALALERAEPDVMQRAPRDPTAEIFSREFVWVMLGYAALIAAACLTAFLIGLDGAGEERRRAVTMCFVTLGLAQAFHLGNARSRARVISAKDAFANPWAIGAVVLVVGLQVLAVEAPPLARLLQTQPLALRDWVTVFALAALPAIVGQAMKPASVPRSPRPDGKERDAR